MVTERHQRRRRPSRSVCYRPQCLCCSFARKGREQASSSAETPASAGTLTSEVEVETGTRGATAEMSRGVATPTFVVEVAAAAALVAATHHGHDQLTMLEVEVAAARSQGHDLRR